MESLVKIEHEVANLDIQTDWNSLADELEANANIKEVGNNLPMAKLQNKMMKNITKIQITTMI